MPYRIRKLPNQEFYRVTNIETGKVMAYKTTKQHAHSQVKMLMMLEHGPSLNK